MEVVSRQGTRARTLGLAVVAAFAGFSIFLIEADTEPADGGAWIYVSVVTVIAAALWWLAVAKPLDREAGNTPAKVGLVIGILALVSNLAFWAGYDAVLGIAAVVLGVEGARRARAGEGRARMAKGATILGGISVGAFVVLMIAWAIAALT
jgi:hypothetical protein